MQVFEWCNYMMRSKEPQIPKSIVTSGMGTKGIVDSAYRDQLHAHYKRSITGYSKILNEYEMASRRAKTTRKKNEFQDKSLWNPTGRQLTSDERILLLGPSNDVIFYKLLSVHDSATNRTIQYSIRPSDMKQPGCNSSFVYLKKHSGSAHPQFASIVKLFAHKFTETYYWAVLDFYPHATYNSNCNMWYVQASLPFIKRDVIPLDHLSYPLVVAYENKQHYWFLNYAS